MKNIGWLGFLLLYLCLFAHQACFGQAPPPNDNYSNSIALSGTDLTFSGTLTGATLEDSQETAADDEAYAGITPPTQSVWWNWTAPVSTVLTFYFQSSSRLNPTNDDLDALFIYYATNGSTSPGGLTLPALGSKLILFQYAPQTLSIPVTAGTNYQIQLIGCSSASYTIRLVATNAPVIVAQPRSQTVYSNASALFYVVAAGTSPNSFTYQWRFNGNDLANQTAPMLALTNIDGAMAGNYSVVISNSSGFAISQPATLSVSQSNVPISLAVLGVASNHPIFSLTCENGRLYRIQSSTDLVNWAPETSFPIGGPITPNATSIVFNSNSPLILTVTNNLSRKFFRATPYVISSPDAEICINNMREIRIAKLFWQRINTEYFGSRPLLSDLLPYFPNQTAPFCPLDDHGSFEVSYTIGELEDRPICNLGGPQGSGGITNHFLEDPQ